MKRFPLFFLFLVWMASFAQTQTTVLKADDNSKDAEEIKKLEFYFADLLTKRDLETYASNVADDYIRIDALGGKMTKDQVLSEFKSSKAGSLTPDNLEVRIYGGTAILNGHLRTEREVDGKTIMRDALFTKVFVKHKGRWILVNNQGTLVRQTSEDHP
jgi:ketosteroid isomerase-like protein